MRDRSSKKQADHTIMTKLNNKFKNKNLEQVNFKVVVSNPPYQDSSNLPIYFKYHEIGVKISNYSSFITPARWWFGNSGLLEYRHNLLLNKNLKRVIYANSKESSKIFPSVEINGGISIISTTPDKNKFFNHSMFFGKTFNNLAHENNVTPINPEDYALANHVNKLVSSGIVDRLSRNSYIKYRQFNKTAESMKNYKPILVSKDTSEFLENRIGWYGNLSGELKGKSDYYSIIKPKVELPHLNDYKVCLKQSIIENSNRKTSTFILPPNWTWGRSAVSLKTFTTLTEAENFLKYSRTRIFDKLLRLTIEGRMIFLGYFIPDLMDYTMNNPLFQDNNTLGQDHAYYNLNLEERLTIFFNLKNFS